MWEYIRVLILVVIAAAIIWWVWPIWNNPEGRYYWANDTPINPKYSRFETISSREPEPIPYGDEGYQPIHEKYQDPWKIVDEQML